LSNVGGASSIWNGGVKAKRMRMYYPWFWFGLLTV
jgi:hypothetical protein